MNKNIEYFRRLHDVAKAIVDDGSADADAVAALRTAVRCVLKSYPDLPEEEGLRRLFESQGELGDALRGAFAVLPTSRVDDAEEFAKAGNRDYVGAQGLASAIMDHALDRLDHLRRKHGFTKAKESPMKDNLTSIMKDLGPIGVAKQIVAEGRTFGISESDFTSAAANHAAKQHPGLRPDAAFAKLYEAEEIVRRAVGVLKSAPLVADLTPLVVGGAAAQALDDPAEAIAQLKQLGAQRYPSASASAQFEKALTDPANHKLARIAVPIPRATTSFAFPSR